MDRTSLTKGIGPRVIRLSLKLNLAYNPDLDYAKYEQCDVVAKSAVPALLHACHEARIVALQVYKQAFASRLRDAVYFDFNQDILFGKYNVISAFSAKGEKVENAIPAQEEPIRRLMISDTQPGAIVVAVPLRTATFMHSPSRL